MTQVKSLGSSSGGFNWKRRPLEATRAYLPPTSCRRTIRFGFTSSSLGPTWALKFLNRAESPQYMYRALK